MKAILITTLALCLTASIVVSAAMLALGNKRDEFGRRIILIRSYTSTNHTPVFKVVTNYVLGFKDGNRTVEVFTATQ